MPELSRFYNIVIKMIYNDNSQHHKPHFHVYFAEYEASVGVDGGFLQEVYLLNSLNLFKLGLLFMRMSCIRRGIMLCKVFLLGK